MSDNNLRNCFSWPIPEIFESARLLDLAVRAHLEGNQHLTVNLIRQADMPVLGDWLDPLWLRRSDTVKARKVEGLPPGLPREERHQPRNAPTEMRRALVDRDGHHRRFCGMPLVRAEVQAAPRSCALDAPEGADRSTSRLAGDVAPVRPCCRPLERRPNNYGQSCRHLPRLQLWPRQVHT